MTNVLHGKLIDFTNKAWALQEILPLVFEKQLSSEGYSEFLFYQEKYFPGLPRRLNPSFPLNQHDAPSFLLVQSSFGQVSEDRDPLATILGLIDVNIKVLISIEPLDSRFSRAAINKGLVNIIVEDEIFHILKKNQSSIAQINLSDFTLTIDDKQYQFSIEQYSETVISQGMNQIDYTLTFNEAINNYEAHFISFDE